jgi:hypothetical protein
VSALGWTIAVLGGLLLAVALASCAPFVRRRLGRARRRMRGCARRLGGRLDPATEGARSPAVLAELDGRLVRAAGWPDDASPAPYLEICTPVEGVTSPLVVVRRSEAARLRPLVGDEVRRLPVAEHASGVVAVYGHAAAWSGRLFERHPTWVLLELDYRMLRVLTRDPQAAPFDAAAAERAVRGFGAAVPAILAAAGLTKSSARGRRR